MTARHWTLDDIPWGEFDPEKVDPSLLKVVKAASMVEFNGRDYAAYLCNVFPDDRELDTSIVRTTDGRLGLRVFWEQW